MRASVIIPTHDPKFLAETLASVRVQDYPDIEILVVPNNMKGPVPSDLGPGVRVVSFGGPPVVGAVKRFAFTQASGDILIELDHDDLLVQGAVTRIVQTFRNTGADFVYSDFAEFNHDGKPRQAWENYWGWVHARKVLMGHDCVHYHAFEPSPAAVGLVMYAPNHVRAWTRDFYRKCGGHDPRLSICDDHDLVIRTYLMGKMVRIPECLYLYRVHGENTWLKRQAEITKETWQLYSRNIEALVLRWATQSGRPCIELNPGYEPVGGWMAHGGFDTSGRWPWEDGAVGAFRAYDFLHGCQDKVHAMSEIHRCLAPGGWLLSFTPSAPSKGAFMDPTARSYWNDKAFWYWTDRAYAKWIKNDKVRFQAYRLVDEYPSDWHRQNDIRYVTLDAVAMKPGYDGPGPHGI